MDNATSPNILLVIADSVRAQNVSLYGHLNRTTPFLDSFASEATVYTEPVSPGTWSLPSHASIFTGYHVWEHRLTSFNDSLRPGHTIWEGVYDGCLFNQPASQRRGVRTQPRLRLRDAVCGQPEISVRCRPDPNRVQVYGYL